MKVFIKFVLSFTALLCLTVSMFGQTTTPRINRTQLNYAYVPVADTAGAGDTVALYPQAWQTWVSINNQDTLKGTVTLKLTTNTKSYLDDRIFVVFKYTGTRRDTINFTSSFITDSSSVGSTNRIITPLGTAKTDLATFLFDGSKFVQQ